MFNKRPVNIGEYTEQEELSRLWELYTSVHLKQNAVQPANLPPISGSKIVHSADGAMVKFNSEIRLLGDLSDCQKEAIIPKSIAEELINAAAECLVHGHQSVPSELRLCFAVNHQRKHWTGALITINSFHEFYQSISKLNFEKSDDKTINHNNAKNAILKALGISELTNADLYTTIVLNKFQSEDGIHISHMDSLNRGDSHDRIQSSLSSFKHHFNFNPVNCSQQKDNTCGDHTVANLFSLAVYSKVPAINSRKSKITSSWLRKLTNLVGGRMDNFFEELDLPENNDNVQLIDTLIKNLSQSQSPAIDNPKAVKMAREFIKNLNIKVNTNRSLTALNKKLEEAPRLDGRNLSDLDKFEILKDFFIQNVEMIIHVTENEKSKKIKTVSKSLVENLLDASDVYFNNPTLENYKTFMNNANSIVRKAEKKFHGYDSLKAILGNIAIAIACFIVLYPVALLVNKAINNSFFFFSKPSLAARTLVDFKNNIHELEPIVNVNTNAMR